MHSETGEEDGAAAYLGAGLAELARDDTAAARAARSAQRRMDKLPESGEEQAAGELPDLSVMASGNLGLIAFAMVRSESHGAVAIGARGKQFLDERRVDGEDPLGPFGPNAADHLRRTDAFPHCPDVMVNSAYWDEAGEVAAFEELVGSHGGLGGTQSHPFVLYPAELPWPKELVVGSEHVHRIFRGWLAGLGHSAYSSSDSPGESTRTATSGASSAT